MAKISPVSSKYIVQANIEIDGVVDRPDVIGAVFGQTEGLLGADLELRELQRSGRIGRIEVNTEIKAGKTKGNIVIPSSLDKAETAIIAAALEIIQRIGPCNAKIKVEKIEDIRVSKRHFVVERAKELLKSLMASSMPDSQEISEEVANSVRIMEIQEYGRDRLPAGPAIDESEEIIIVEGRADVINLLKHGFKNVIAVGGTSVPETLKDLCAHKETTVFVDGDRGGDLIIRGLLQVTDIDFVTKAPDGKEVEELAKKEIHKALRARIAAEQVKLELPTTNPAQHLHQSINDRHDQRPRMQPIQPLQKTAAPVGKRPLAPVRSAKLSDSERKTFIDMLNDLVGTRGAYILDQKMNLLGKVPYTELGSTIKSMEGNAYAVVFDGAVEEELVRVAENANVKFLVGMESKIRPQDTRVTVLTINNI